MSAQEDHRVETGWQQSAACRGQHAPLFFPPQHFEAKQARLGRERRAKTICAGCAVRDDCLQFALRTLEPHGVWGGLNELERRDLTLSLGQTASVRLR